MQSGGLDGLNGLLDMAEGLAARQVASEQDLILELNGIYRALFTIDFAGFDIAAVRRDAPRLADELFLLGLALRRRIPEWHAQGCMTRAAQVALRDVFRAARYAHELLGEIALGHPRRAPDEPVRAAFSGPASYTDLNPDFASTGVTFEPGDVILQRGMAHNSAAIARIGDVDSQFSHVAMVARDPGGELVVVEAVIEDGSVVVPLQQALEHGIGRAILFRHRNRALAEAAADLIRNDVLRADGTIAPRMLYDFSMELPVYDQLFCAKLVRLAYAMASDGRFVIPTYPTLLAMRNRDFISRIGVTAMETFAPADMELETDFDIVAEWRDYRVSSELRLKDMIMTKLFEWMEVQGYRFRPTFGIHLASRLGWLSARMPASIQRVATRFTGARVPPNMTTSAIGAVAMLHATGEKLYARLKELEDKSIRDTGRQLHPRQVLQHLEAMRGGMGRKIGYLVEGD
jgi:hypothetical protein